MNLSLAVYVVTIKYRPYNLYLTNLVIINYYKDEKKTNFALISVFNFINTISFYNNRNLVR